MQDPFLKARAMHAGMPQQMGAPAAPAAPMPAGPTAPQAHGMDLGAAMHKAGISHLQLDKNPTIARAQLMQHLSQKYGPGYVSHPEAQQVLNAFNQQPTQGQTAAMPTNQAKNMQALLGKR